MKLLNNLINNHAGSIGIAAMVTWAVDGFLIISDFPEKLGALKLFLTYFFLVFYFVGLQISWYRSFSSRKTNELGLLIMVSSLIGLGWSQPQSIYLVLIVVFAGVLPYFYSIIKGVAIVVALYAIGWAFATYHWQYDNAFLPNLTYLSFSAFSFFTSYTVNKETDAKEELASTHQQLLATQQLLTDSAVNNERLRISRDLHDAIGHHLTAMSLQLEVARNLSKDKALGHVEQAHSLTKLLLADVREVVSDLRLESSLDIRNSLKKLAGSAKATVNLVIDANVDINKTKVIETVFRLVQEMITNSNRYSSTGQLNFHICESENDWRLSCDDAGSSPSTYKPGTGIVGMRERVEQLGGQFSLTTEKGFRYNILLPKND